MRRSQIAAVLVVATLLAACSSNKKSIIDTGSPATPPSTAAASTVATTASAATTTAPATTTATSGSSAGTAPSTGATSTTAAASTTSTAPATTAAPATTVADLSAFPACPTDALAAAKGPIKITVWDGMMGDLLTEFNKLVAEYNASQTKVHVDAISQGGYEDVIDKYLQSGKGSLPDIAQMPEYAVQNIVDTKTAVPAAACMRADSFDASPFIPGALQAYSTGGVQWSMPFNVSDPVLFYNKKIFTAAGLDPDKPPASLQDLRDDSQKIVSSGAATFGLSLDSGFDSGGGWYIEQWFAQLGKYYADNNNGRSARATKVLYDDATGVDLLTQLQTMINDKLAKTVGDNASGIDNLLALGDKTQPAAMTIATSASLGSVIAILKTGQFPVITPDDIGVAPLPGPDGAKGAIVGGASLWMANSGDPAKIAAAWDFEKFMVGAQQQSEWSAATGYIAVRNDARTLDPLKTTLATDPRYAVALDQLNLLANSPTAAGPILGPLREVRTVTAQAVAKIFGGADVQKSLTDAANQADALITAYNQNNS